MRRTGQKLLRFDRRLGVRFVAGTDEAGRGSLAGPLVVAGVLLDYACLRDHRVRPLTYLNDSKQVAPSDREVLYRGVVGCAERIVIDRGPSPIHRRSWRARCYAELERLAPPAAAGSRPAEPGSAAGSTR